MKKLIAGLHQFQSGEFNQERDLYQRLAEGQQPRALFITCSDSRVDPNRLLQAKPGEVFVQRTAGNIVPPYGAVLGGEAATIEYAVSVLKIKDIVICGHSHCGAMSGLLNLEALESLPAVRAYLQYADSTRRVVRENYPEVTDPEKQLSLAVQENVLMQLENLKTHPSVAAALGRAELTLHGWFYRFETGEVSGFNPDKGRFVPVEGLPSAAPARQLPVE